MSLTPTPRPWLTQPWAIGQPAARPELAAALTEADHAARAWQAAHSFFHALCATGTLDDRARLAGWVELTRLLQARQQASERALALSAPIG